MKRPPQISFAASPEAAARYIERRKGDLELCRRSLAEGNFETIAAVGHRLRGSAPSFGHADLGEIGAQLEQAAQAGLVGVLRVVIEDFAHWITQHSAPTSSA